MAVDAGVRRRSSSSNRTFACSISTPSRSRATRRATPELQLRMQGNAFQGAFFAACDHAGIARFPRSRRCSMPSKTSCSDKFGGKGARVVEDNLRVVRRGYDELREITDKTVSAPRRGRAAQASRPADHAQADAGERRPAIADIHRFWEQTGSFYAHGDGQRQPRRPVHRPGADAGRDRRCSAT